MKWTHTQDGNARIVGSKNVRKSGCLKNVSYSNTYSGLLLLINKLWYGACNIEGLLQHKQVIFIQQHKLIINFIKYDAPFKISSRMA